MLGVLGLLALALVVNAVVTWRAIWRLERRDDERALLLDNEVSTTSTVLPRRNTPPGYRED